MLHNPARLISLSLLVFHSAALMRASSSGLNNIPTADIAPNLTIVFQGYSFAGAQQYPNHFAAFKFGIGPWESSGGWRNGFEFGVDGRVGPGDPGPAVLQAKWSTQPTPAGPAISVGVANVAGSAGGRRQAGAPFSFLVLTQDFKFFRLSGGYGLQAGRNNSAILGIDRTVKVFHHDLMFRSDATQIQHQNDWAASFGALYGFCRYFAMESWITQPVHGGRPTFVLKVDLVAKLRKN